MTVAAATSSIKPKSNNVKVTDYLNIMITGRPGTGKTTLQMVLLVPFNPKFKGTADGTSTDWEDFKAKPDKYVKSVEYFEESSGMTKKISIMETPGIGQVNDIDADIVHLLRIILEKIKDYEVLRVILLKIATNALFIQLPF